MKTTVRAQAANEVSSAEHMVTIVRVYCVSSILEKQSQGFSPSSENQGTSDADICVAWRFPESIDTTEYLKLSLIEILQSWDVQVDVFNTKRRNPVTHALTRGTSTVLEYRPFSAN